MQFQSHKFDQRRTEITNTMTSISGAHEVSEKILVMDDHYIGHRFRCNGMQVDWLSRENQIIARDDHGARIDDFESLMKTHGRAAVEAPQKRAA